MASLSHKDLIKSQSTTLPIDIPFVIWLFFYQQRLLEITNAGILLIQTLGTNFNDFLSEIGAFSFKKMHLKMSSGKWRPSCFGLNVLRPILLYQYGITKPRGLIKSQTPTLSIEILLVI